MTYLFLGGDTAIPKNEVLGIFDMDNASSSLRTREFLKRAEQQGDVENAADDLPKSFIVCADEKGQRVYLSQLSSATLLKRAGAGGGGADYLTSVDKKAERGRKSTRESRCGADPVTLERKES